MWLMHGSLVTMTMMNTWKVVDKMKHKYLFYIVFSIRGCFVARLADEYYTIVILSLDYRDAVCQMP